MFLILRFIEICGVEGSLSDFFCGNPTKFDLRNKLLWFFGKRVDFFFFVFQSVKQGEPELLHIIEGNLLIFHNYSGNRILSRRFKSF